jgi:hypothetical protein
LIGAMPLVAAASIGLGIAIFGMGEAHQLFRDLGPASFVTSGLTLACATLGALIARREAGAADWRDLNNFWFLAAAGFLFLSIDAPLDIHGVIGDLIEREAGAPPAIQHFSDAVLGIYMLLGLGLCAVHWRELARVPRAAIMLAAGGLLSAGMLAIDGGTAQSPWQQVAEESVELVAAAVLVVAFLERFRFSLRMESPDRAGEPAS